MCILLYTFGCMLQDFRGPNLRGLGTQDSASGKSFVNEAIWTNFRIKISKTPWEHRMQWQGQVMIKL